jgi:hypothetical protein
MCPYVKTSMSNYATKKYYVKYVVLIKGKEGPLSINGIFDLKMSQNGVYTEGSLFRR